MKRDQILFFDNSLWLELYLNKTKTEIADLFSSFKRNFVVGLASFQLPLIQQALKDKMGPKGKDAFLTFLTQEEIHFFKTPSYIDKDDPLLRDDIVLYLLKLSAEAVNAVIITKNKDLTEKFPQLFFTPEGFKRLNWSANMPFCNLKRQYLLLHREIEKNLDRVFNHQHFINGKEIETLEKKCAQFIGTKHAIGVSSGTDALLLSLMACGVGKNDYVITTPFTFIATAEAIALLGAIPLFVDINPETFNLEPANLKKVFDAPRDPQTQTPIPLERIKALIAVDLYGQPAPWDEIKEVVPPHVALIEDAAQAFGAIYKNKRAGNLANVGITSFFPAKPLGACGDGGMIFTNDDELALKIRWLKDHGQDKRYHHKLIGLNARLDTLQAAVLLAKFKKFKDEEIEKRNEVANLYNEVLKGLEKEGKIKLPTLSPNVLSAWAQYTILTPHRDKLQHFLQHRGIPTAIHYPRPLHLQEAFFYLGYKQGDFPIAEQTAQRVISLPMDAWKTKEEIYQIAAAIKDFFV